MSDVKRDDGGPAFPTEPNTQPGMYVHHGMTLRDYFAGQAMVGCYAALDEGIRTSDEDLAMDAALFYRIADAMLAARKP